MHDFLEQPYNKSLPLIISDILAGNHLCIYVCTLAIKDSFNIKLISLWLGNHLFYFSDILLFLYFT